MEALNESVSTEMNGIGEIKEADDKIYLTVGSGQYEFTSDLVTGTTDKSELRSAIAKAKALEQINYDREAWQELTEILNLAIAVRDSKDATQEAVDAITVSLQEKIVDMENHFNQSRKALKEAVEAAEKVNWVAHPMQYVVAYQKALQQATDGCKDLELSDEQLDEQKDTLAQATADLADNNFTNYALNKDVTARTSHEDSYWGWGKAFLIDGDRKKANNSNEYTGYSSIVGDDKNSDHEEWVYVDLGEVEEINAISIYAATQAPQVKQSCYGFPKNFTIQVSKDAENWEDVIIEDAYAIPNYEAQNFTFQAVEARYVKLYARNLNPKATDNNFYYLQLSEFEVYYSMSEITEMELGNFAIPTARITTDQRLINDPQKVSAALIDGSLLKGQWSAEDGKGNDFDLTKYPVAGTYQVLLTFDAPYTAIFKDALKDTSGQGYSVSVKDGGRKLVYSFEVNVSAKVTEVSATGISVNPNKISIEVGNKSILKAQIIPANVTNGNVVWKSKNEAVVTVDGNGAITAKKAGTATITATTSNGMTAECTVTVVAKKEIAVKSVKLNVKKLVLGVGEKPKLTVTVTPSNATNRTIKWSSKNSKVASVNSKGKITAKKVGKTSVIATASNGKKATCQIQVKKAPTNVKLSAAKKTLKIGRNLKIKATLSKGSTGAVTFSVNNKRLASISKGGTLKALRKGTVTVKVKTYNGKKATLKIKIIK